MDPTRRDVLPALLALLPNAAPVLAASETADAVLPKKRDPKNLEELTESYKELHEALQKVTELYAFLSRTSPPVGTIVTHAGADAPECWLFCDGSVLDPAKNPEHRQLAELIGTTFDPERKVVRLPDLRGRAVLGAGHGSGLSKRLPGERGGAEAHTLTVAELASHAHAVTDPGHDHRVITEKEKSAEHPLGGGRGHHDRNQRTSNEKTGISIQAAGGNQAHNNMQPFLVLSCIIKYK